MRPTTKTVSKTISMPNLPGGSGERLWAEVTGREIVAHLLVGGFDEPRVFEDPLDLIGGSVTADVLFLHYVPKMRPVADAVADVLEDFVLPLSAGSTAKEDPVQNAVLLLVHLYSFRLRGSPRTFYAT